MEFKRTWVVPLCAALAVTCIAHGGSLWGTRVFDDFHSVFNNPPVQDPANIVRFFSEPRLFSIHRLESYRPVTLTTYALTFALFGESLPAFHAGNFLVHMACTFAVYFLILALLRSAGYTAPERASAVGALVFGAHPAAGQVVHYISSRSESLAFLGIAGAASCHAWSLVAPTCARRRRILRAAAILLVALALCAKETGILALPALIAADLALDSGGIATMRARLARLGTPMIMVAVYFVFRLLPTPGGPASTASADMTGLLDRSAWLAESLRALWVYLTLSFFPAQLAMWRELTPSAAPALSAWSAGILLFGTLAASSLLLVRKGWRLAGLAGLLYAVPFVPYLVRPLHLVVNENRIYPPLAGLALAAALLYAGPLSRWIGGRRPGRRVVTALGLCLLGAALLRDWRVSYTWASETRVWENAISVSPNSGDIRGGLGTAYMRQKRWQKAREQFIEALALPTTQRAVVYDNLGIASYMLGEKDAAYRYFRQALAFHPGSVEVLNNLGSILHEMERPDEALGYLDQAVQLSPDYCEPHLEAIAVMRTLDKPRGAEARIGALPVHCASDPRVAASAEWARTRAQGR